MPYGSSAQAHSSLIWLVTTLNQLTESIHIWHSRVPSTPPDTSCCSPEEIAKAAKFVRPVDQRRHLATRKMIRELLSQYHPLSPSQWRFIENAYGKPSVDPQITSELHFNVSHTCEVIVLAIASFPHIGIDVEDRIPDDVHEVSHHFFAAGEIDWLNEARNDLEARERFITIWTLKEAYIKAVGKGLSIPLDSFSVAPKDTTIRVEDQDVNGFHFRRFNTAEAPIAVAYPKQFAGRTFELQNYELS